METIQKIPKKQESKVGRFYLESKVDALELERIGATDVIALIPKSNDEPRIYVCSISSPSIHSKVKKVCIGKPEKEVKIHISVLASFDTELRNVILQREEKAADSSTKRMKKGKSVQSDPSVRALQTRSTTRKIIDN